MNGKPVRVGSDLVTLLSTRKFGDTVKLQVVTGDKPARTVPIRLGGATADRASCSVDDANTGKG
jgi:S1-C subfamily serine protease